jgi:hypothetical protein
MGPTCPETSVQNYHSTLLNIAEERRSLPKCSFTSRIPDDWCIITNAWKIIQFLSSLYKDKLAHVDGMEAYWTGIGSSKSPLILNFGLSCLLHELVASTSRTPPGTHRVLDWVGSRAGLDGLEKRSVAFPTGSRTTFLLVSCPCLVTHCTNCANPVHAVWLARIIDCGFCRRSTNAWPGSWVVNHFYTRHGWGDLETAAGCCTYVLCGFKLCSVKWIPN